MVPLLNIASLGLAIQFLAGTSYVEAFTLKPNHRHSVSPFLGRNSIRSPTKLWKSGQEERTFETEANEVLEEANDALTSVGWSRPMGADDLTSDDPFVRRINAQIEEESGVGLDGLLNPAKVVNLERELFNLRLELAKLTGKGEIDVLDMSTEECDGGGGGEEADSIRKSITKKESTLAIERRSVFRGWLKNIFLGQAVLSLGISWIMVTDPAALFGGFDWFQTNNLDISIKALGFWWWWLFIVPSLRSRRPSGPEKKALDIAFLGTPLISIIAPIATKDTAIIWFANFAVVAGSYGYAFLSDDDDNDTTDDSSKQPAWLKFIYKSLDFGSGRERGARN